MAENQYPIDEFDELAAQRQVAGAHRRRKSNRSWWIALVAIVILAPLAGWGVVNALGYHGTTSPTAHGTTASAPASVTPTVTTPATDAATTSAPVETATPTEEPQPSAEPTTEAPQADHSMPVLVLNATKINGLAGKMKASLDAAGFTSVSVGDYRYATPAASQIYYPSEEAAVTATAVASALGIDPSNLILDAGATGGSQIVVVLAGDVR